MIKFSDLSPVELRKYQLKLLDMLKYFDKICTKYNLTYYMTYGSCLGAVRHHGFIPWDDDFDVALPRKDYEKLHQIWGNDQKNSRYILCRPSKDHITHTHITLLRDAETTCIYTHSTNIDTCHGIKIDICPIDGCPDNKYKRIIQSIYTQIFGLFAAQRVPNHASKAKKVLTKVLLCLIKSPNLRYKLWHFAEKHLSKYNYDECTMVRTLNSKPFSKKIFGNPVRLMFEDGSYPVPEQYDKYLESIYGDYMKLPPEEKRKPETEVECFDLNKSYVNYCGISYLVKSR